MDEARRAPRSRAPGWRPHAECRHREDNAPETPRRGGRAVIPPARRAAGNPLAEGRSIVARRVRARQSGAWARWQRRGRRSVVRGRNGCRAGEGTAEPVSTIIDVVRPNSGRRRPIERAHLQGPIGDPRAPIYLRRAKDAGRQATLRDAQPGPTPRSRTAMTTPGHSRKWRRPASSKPTSVRPTALRAKYQDRPIDERGGTHVRVDRAAEIFR